MPRSILPLLFQGPEGDTARSIVNGNVTGYEGGAQQATPTFFFLRLARLMRVVRIFNVISRVSRTRVRYQRKRKRALSAILSPPKCNWREARRTDGQPVKAFACFLSHYKAEAGSDARYLYDLLSSILDAPIYLDSTKLTDLQTLFSDGVHKSEVIVLLASEAVLSRPWSAPRSAPRTPGPSVAQTPTAPTPPANASPLRLPQTLPARLQVPVGDL